LDATEAKVLLINSGLQSVHVCSVLYLADVLQYALLSSWYMLIRVVAFGHRCNTTIHRCGAIYSQKQTAEILFLSSKCSP
jgi:hypothetical protein